VGFTTGRDFHPALKIYSIYILYYNNFDFCCQDLSYAATVHIKKNSMKLWIISMD
jgi:hypothetical protein